MMNAPTIKAAQQALKELGEARKIIRASSSRQLAKDWDRRATAVLAGLRTAIQQPATPEPVAWIRRHPNGALSNELLLHVQVEQVRRDSGAWVPLYTHLATGVPDDVVRDAERYRELVRSGRYCPASLGTHWALATCSTRPSTKAELDAPIDAMLAAYPAQKGTTP